MKKVITLLIIGFVVITNLNAQSFQGIATYKTHRNIDVKLDSTQVNSDMQKQITEMMKKQFQKTFNLTFNKQESVYKEEESLDKPTINTGDFIFQVVGNGGGNDVLYKNIKDNNYADQKETMGKQFLIKDNLKNINWKLESETKFIGEYQCYKAIYTKMVEVSKVNFSSGSKNKEKADAKKTPEKEERIVTAWYTPQIPVNNGPGLYQGLPGLILEVHDGKLHIVCSKIIINPDEKIEIKKPQKGKQVNQKEYDDIMEKKAKEMMERYAPRNGRDSGGIEIRIGG